MSMMICDRCDRWIDTDSDCEGDYFDEFDQYFCGICIDNWLNEYDEDQTVMTVEEFRDRFNI